MTLRLIVCVATCLFGGLVSAQTPAPDSQPRVDATGEAVIERSPDTLRLSMQLMAKHMQMKACLDQLKERGEAAKAQLVALGATKESVKIGSAHIDENQANYRKQMEMMMAQQMRQRGKKKKAEIVYPTVVVAQLTAEWPLTGKSVDEILILAHDLSDKIKSADLSGSKKSEKLLPEEEEMMEESEGMANFQRYGQGNEKPGEPVFLYVSTIPADVQEKAFADAFQRAKVDAARLAQAAGASLGRVLSLRKDDSVTPFDAENFRGFSGEYAQIMLARQAGNRHSKTMEAVGPTPDNIQHRVRVAVGFQLRTK